MGELPDKETAQNLEKDFHERHEVPQYVWDVLRTMPENSHPMTMLSTAVLVMERDSIFRRRYNLGMPKEEYWEAALQDALNLLGKLPIIAGGIYRLRFGKGEILKAISRHKDWAGCYAEALGVENLQGEFADFLRLYLVLHSDHEGGNVSANTCHTVGSALSSPYLAVAAGLNGLAGPLHGLANQECLKFVLNMIEEYGAAPTKEQITEYAWNTLNSGKVIPGYGHAVLRKTDPRFTAFHDFGKKVCSETPTFKTVAQMYEIIPEILKEHGKAKNPYPNVDAVSGSLLYHYDVKEFDYYTVLFGVSRSLGMLSQLILNRALGTPITRPKSVRTSWIKEQVGAK